MDVDPLRTLLVCCGALRLGTDAIASRFRNLTVNKISKMMPQKCEWGHDDHSLNVENLPSSSTSARRENADDAAAHSAKGGLPQPGLFDEADA